MSYANAQAIKTALDNGATYSAGKIVDGGVAKFCLLQDGVWTLDASTGVLVFNKAHYTQMKNGTYVSEGEYAGCFDVSTGRFQLAAVEENGVTKAKLINP